MKPIIKYPGGKSQLLPEITQIIQPLLLENTNCVFYEPFCGGAAVSLALQHPNTVLNDVNKELMNMYNQVKTNVEGVLRELAVMSDQHKLLGDKFYYGIRNLDRDLVNFSMLYPEEKAARFLYLNHTCFNGLYRVNSKGEFNAPIGKTSSGKLPDIVRVNDTRELSTFLQSVKLQNTDYRNTLVKAKPGDVIYLDPPYDYENNNGFVSYTKDGWTRKDLIQLKEFADSLIDKNCYVIISNNATSFVKELFGSDTRYVITEVSARRNINCKGTGRTGTIETIIYSCNCKK